MTRKIFFTLTAAALAYWFLFDFLRWAQYDNESYVHAARLLFAIDGGANEMGRISKPVFIFLPGLFEKLFDIHPQYIFIVQNVFFFYLNGLLFYKILHKICKNDFQAYMGMLAYITCQPFAVFSLFMMADGSGWFFELLIIYLILQIIFSGSYTKAIQLMGLGAIMVIGMLTKESVAAAIIFSVFIILFYTVSLQKKIGFLLLLLFTFIILFLLLEWVLYLKYHYSLLDVIRKSRYERSYTYYYNLKNIRQVYRILDVYWLFFIAAIIVWCGKIYIKRNKILHLKDGSQKTEDRSRFRLPTSVFQLFINTTIYPIFSIRNKKVEPDDETTTLKASLITLLIVLIILPLGWPYIIDRVLFMAAPFAIIIASYGIIYFKQYALPLTLFAGICNVITQYCIYKYHVENMIGAVMLIYILLLAAISYRSYKIKSIF